MVKSALYLLTLAILSILSIFAPNKAFALTVCQNISECTAGQEQIIKVYLYADGNPECVDNRQFYNCSETTCFQDSTTCTEQQLICNNGAGNTPNDGYTCNRYCNDLAIPDHCGNYPASDGRPTCSNYINQCLTRYCVPSGGGTNYTCPSPQECISPPDPKAHQCITPTPITPPLPSPTCPIGPAQGGITYSCETGSSCLTGFTRSGLYTCSSGNTCCYSSTIKYKCVNNACVSDNGDGSGTYTDSSCLNSCTTPPAPAPPLIPAPTTPPPVSSAWCHIGPASQTGSDSGTAAVTYSGVDRIDWKLNGNLVYPNTTTDLTRGSSNTFSNLSPQTTYTVTGIGWCQNCTNNSVNCSGNPSFRTGRPTPPPPGNLQCFVPVGVAGQDIDIGRWRIGDPGGARRESSPNMNLNGTLGYRVGEGCYRPGTNSEPTSGTIGGYVYLKDCPTCDLKPIPQTGMGDYADLTWTFYWVYSTLPNAVPMCGMNNNQWCFTAAQNPWMWFASTGTSYNGGKVSGNTGSALYQGNNVTLISWDPRYKPVGYYEYQGDSTPQDCEGTCDYTCREINRRFKPWSHPMVNGAYNWQSSAEYCDTQGNHYASGSNLSLPNLSLTARVDFLFQKLGRFTVQGTVYKDDNRDGVKQDTETTTIPDADITLTGVGSTQTDANGHYLFTNVTEGSYTISAQADNFYPTNPVNGTATISFTAPITQDFLMKKLYKIQGTVRTANPSGNCSTTNPGFKDAALSLSGSPADYTTQSFTTTGSGAYQFINLDYGDYALRVNTQTNSQIRPSSPFYIPQLGSDSLNNDFCVNVSRPWIQTEGDIHSNTKIDLPAAPR